MMGATMEVNHWLRVTGVLLCRQTLITHINAEVPMFTNTQRFLSGCLPAFAVVVR